MAGPFGVSFAPTTDGSAEAQQQQQQSQRRSQQALEVRNLALPTTIAPSAPVSRALLEPKTTSGAPDSAVLASIVRALMGQNAPIPSMQGLTAQRVLGGGGVPGVAAPSMSGGGGGGGEDLGADRGGSGSPIRQASRDAGPFSSAPSAPAPVAPAASAGPFPSSPDPGRWDWAQGGWVGDTAGANTGQSTYDPWQDLDRRAEQYAASLGGGEAGLFSDQVASYYAQQAPAPGRGVGGGSTPSNTPNVTFPYNDRPNPWAGEGGW